MAEILLAQIQRNGEHMNRNKFGSIRQLPSGRFQVRYRDVHGINRTAKTNTGKSLTFDTRTAARKHLVYLESAMDQGKEISLFNFPHDFLADCVNGIACL